MKYSFVGIAFLSMFCVVSTLEATDWIERDGAFPILTRSTFETGAQIELPICLLQEWLKSYLEKPVMITQAIDGDNYHITIKGFEKKQEVDVFLGKSATDTALFTPFKGRMTDPVGSWFHHEYWELWFYVSRQQMMGHNFS